MNLLLTSGGVRNPALVAALFELAGAGADKLNCAFIPTAASVRDEDKRWLIDDLVRLKDLGFHKLDIVDLAARAV